MPRPERLQQRPAQGPPQRPMGGAPPANAFLQVRSDIEALNSSVLLLSQKMQYLVRNEKILGRNLIVLSRRLKELEANGVSGGSNGSLPENVAGQLDELNRKAESLSQKLLELQNDVMELKDQGINREEFKELKYVIDSINPLEFVSQKQLAEAFKEKKGKKK